MSMPISFYKLSFTILLNTIFSASSFQSPTGNGISRDCIAGSYRLSSDTDQGTLNNLSPAFIIIKWHSILQTYPDDELTCRIDGAGFKASRYLCPVQNLLYILPWINDRNMRMTWTKCLLFSECEPKPPITRCFIYTHTPGNAWSRSQSLCLHVAFLHTDLLLCGQADR